MNLLADIRARSLRALIPPPRLRLSQWIEQNIRLPEGVSALPGLVRLWPYQREIADAISDPEIERVTLVKPVRVGFTTLLSGAIGSFVANEPCPVLVLLPTESDARDYMVSDLDPIFSASPILRGTLAEDGERNTLLSKRFAGGSLKLVAAKAPRNLRRHTARILIVDEADAMEVGAEGNPIRLAERRTLSFANRKIIIGSTPLHDDTSHVLRSYAESDQRAYECPCPACGGFTEIMWGMIEWETDKPETAAFRCPHCSEMISERHKAAMVEAGAWRATRPDIKGHAGFRLNALISLLANASWPKLAAEFIAAKDDPSELQTFVNCLLGQGWREASEMVDEAALASRAEPFGLDEIPEAVLIVTMGCDVQDDRIECTITGWSRDGVAFVLGHVVIWGQIADDDTVWLELDELLKTRWRHPHHGGQLKIDAAVIDAGDGDHFEKVLAFCAPRANRRVMAGKGVSGTRPAIQASTSKLKGGRGRLFLVGVDGLKGIIFGKLARGQSIRFSHSLEPVWFEQLASERRVLRYVRGQPVRRFERLPGRRAESLDCMVYAFAARSVCAALFDQRENELRGSPAAQPPTVIRSAWMNR
jgi:phage terminase large subunit GpA-like protein